MQIRSRLLPLFDHFWQRFDTFDRVKLSPIWISNHRTIVTVTNCVCINLSLPSYNVCSRLDSPLRSVQVQGYNTIVNALRANTPTGNVRLTNKLGSGYSPSSQTLTQVRHVVKYSKLGKRKTVKAVAKRFHRTGSGKLKYWPAGKVHNMLAKSRDRRRKLRKAKYVSKTQLKILNKMISGW